MIVRLYAPEARLYEGSVTAAKDDPQTKGTGERTSRAPDSRAPDGRERRSYERFDVEMGLTWCVDCADDATFLYASISNISTLGVFVRTLEPLAAGTKLTLRFSADGKELELAGQVQWVNPVRVLGENLNPGMGVRFVDLSPDDRERLVEVVRTIAYIRDFPQ